MSVQLSRWPPPSAPRLAEINPFPRLHHGGDIAFQASNDWLKLYESGRIWQHINTGWLLVFRDANNVWRRVMKIQWIHLYGWRPIEKIHEVVYSTPGAQPKVIYQMLHWQAPKTANPPAKLVVRTYWQAGWTKQGWQRTSDDPFYLGPDRPFEIRSVALRRKYVNHIHGYDAIMPDQVQSLSFNCGNLTALALPPAYFPEMAQVVDQLQLKYEHEFL